MPIILIYEIYHLLSSTLLWVFQSVLGRQANLKESSEGKELAELRLQVLVVVKTSDACESKKEIMILKSDLQSEGPWGVLLVLICPMTKLQDYHDLVLGQFQEHIFLSGIIS